MDAFTAMTDVTPTLLEMAGINGQVPGAVPISVRSLHPLLTGQLSQVYGSEDAVGIETSGQAALYRGDQKLVRNMPPTVMASGDCSTCQSIRVRPAT